MLGSRFACKFGSLQVSAIGYNNTESLYIRSSPTTFRGTSVIVLAGGGLGRAMPLRSGSY
jgi:hypothetical protein